MVQSATDQGQNCTAEAAGERSMGGIQKEISLRPLAQV